MTERSYANPGTYAGYKIIISYPYIETIKRSWKERLFWKPWVKTKTKIHTSSVSNLGHIVGDCIVMSQEMFVALKKEERNART